MSTRKQARVDARKAKRDEEIDKRQRGVTTWQPVVNMVNDMVGDLAKNMETQTVLEEAMKCVGGPRRRDYGTPDENFGRIADLWNVHLKDKLAKPMTPGDVAMMMILLKVARQANSPKRDNLVDIAGYAQCASELKEEK